MIIVRPAEASDVDAMVDLLHIHMNSKFSRARWRRLFDYAWCPDRPDYGRVAERDGEIIGCIAAIYSYRWIDGGQQCIVNPAAWYLRKDARRAKSSLGTGVGLAMIADLTGNPACHYHINTSSKNTIRLLERIGFTVLDDAKYVWRHSSRAGLGAEIASDPDVIAAAVGEAECQILADHRQLPVKPLLCRAGGDTALLIFSDTIKRPGERWLDVLYVSDPVFLAQHGSAVAAALLTAPDMIMAADCRFCAGYAVGAERVPLEVARYVKSATLGGHHIDHLYSEIQLLDQKLR